MLRTPARKQRNDDEEVQKSPPKTVTLSSKVRRSIGEWEAAKTDETTKSPLSRWVTQAGPSKAVRRKALSQDSPAAGRQTPPGTQKSPIGDHPKEDTEARASPSRTAEARACLSKAKMHLNNSRNLKSDIKAGVEQAIDRLYQLVKEAEAEKKGKGDEVREKGKLEKSPRPKEAEETSEEQEDLRTRLEEHSRLLLENNKKIDEFRASMEKQLGKLERKTNYAKVTRDENGPSYAEMVARRQTLARAEEQTPIHSIVVSSDDDKNTSGEVIEKIRIAVDARSSGIRVERVRKARDQKVVIGCQTQEELNKVKERIGKNKGLRVEEVKNKDPLVILKDVLNYNTDQDIATALRKQNEHLLRGLNEEEIRSEVRYRKKTRNPHTSHVVVRVSPKVWQRLTAAHRVHIDLQRVVVADQSPLVQCSRCLGYGHGRKLCKETADLCAHCGGPHIRSQCDLWMTDVPPTCRNCQMAKYENAEHNAFGDVCPIRKKWDALARSSVAYC